jgi:hypothetical protein
MVLKFKTLGLLKYTTAILCVLTDFSRTMGQGTEIRDSTIYNFRQHDVICRLESLLILPRPELFQVRCL